jgi:Domain of unknown function (DUF5666)
MAAFLTTALLIGLLAGVPATPLVADETGTSKTADTFFAGTVSQFSSETLIVGRTVRGKAESRTFIVTPQTKIDGKLAVKVRVTVRYFTDDDGDTATLIVVRGSAPPAPKPAKQKK